MGRATFRRFLSISGESGHGAGQVFFGNESATWTSLLEAGRKRSSIVRQGGSYVVDPTGGLDALISFFAVATVPDTALLWVAPDNVLMSSPIAPALHEISSPNGGRLTSPYVGVATSGTTNKPKIPVIRGDALEIIALHYLSAVFTPVTGRPSGDIAFATCLPLQFSAALYMTILPALFFGRDLLFHSPHNWRPLAELCERQTVACQCAPIVAVAGSQSLAHGRDLSNLALILGGGHLNEGRLAMIRQQLPGATIANVYGTAETGVISLDLAPGHAAHVGKPVYGKAVWIENPGVDGIGAVTVVGPDCMLGYWNEGPPTVSGNAVGVALDYGHMDDEGRLFLDGRLDSGEKMHGLTIYPRAIERHLLALAGVTDVRVSVRSASPLREYLSASVVGTVSEEQLQEHCRSLDVSFRPDAFEVISEQQALSRYSLNGKLQ